ncbi:MAG: helix-turn-helix domain-containing protein [Lachnospiraceae bacterium]|nr:helix-turn-helix domain-containing protein [Lachnospiraceae bacterium]
MTDIEYSMIGTRIAAVRRSKKMTQETLAEMLDVTSKHVSHVENSTSSFSLKQMIRFCEIFNCSFDYLIFGDERNNMLAELPNDIVQILKKHDPQEIDRLIRYLNIFVEMS